MKKSKTDIIDTAAIVAFIIGTLTAVLLILNELDHMAVIAGVK